MEALLILLAWGALWWVVGWTAAHSKKVLREIDED